MSITCSNAKRGSSRSVVIRDTRPSRPASAITSPSATCAPVTPGNVATAAASDSAGMGGAGGGTVSSATQNRPCPSDLLLQLQDAVDQRLRRGWAAGHVDVHRNHAVAAAHDGVGVVVVAAAVGA